MVTISQGGCKHCLIIYTLREGFPGGSDSKDSACNVGDPGSIPGSGRSPRKGNDYPLQYSRLQNSMDGGAWRATVCGVAKTRTQLSVLSHTHRLREIENGLLFSTITITFSYYFSCCSCLLFLGYEKPNEFPKPTTKPVQRTFILTIMK